MKTTHKIIFKDSRRMKGLPDNCIDLVVTSPPYPMIEMWDVMFSGQNSRIEAALKKRNGPLAWELMHRELDKVWDEVFRVLKRGGIACINIGDATRTINDHFALYTNHARILGYMQKIGFSALPAILWRKQTNAPNKFMGSGMMPPGAYVTLEHEYVLILRKGNKREFTTGRQKRLRRESSFFWEERNRWFSDVWMDLKGTTQNMFDSRTRKRSGSFPFELPYRLITMLSVKGDTVLDPFLGIGTCVYAAMAAGRSSIGYEIDKKLCEVVFSHGAQITGLANNRIAERLNSHLIFVEERYRKERKFKYTNTHYRFPVVTRQETDLMINELQSVERAGVDTFEVVYFDEPQKGFADSCREYVISGAAKEKLKQTRLF